MAQRGQKLGGLNDEELVAYALLGSLEAFDALVRRYRAAVLLTAAQTLGERCRAEDVAQEAFLIAFKALPQLAETARFAGWLRAITRHRARRVLRRESRLEPTEPSRLDRLILEHSLELKHLPTEPCACVDSPLFARLAELPPDYANVLRLRYWEEWPVGRIAAFFSLPVTAIKWRLHHGRAAPPLAGRTTRGGWT